jgi:hypothetical protein
VTKEVAKVAQYAIMQKGKMELVKEMIKENLGDDTITFSDLTRISFPSGKSRNWSIPDIEAEGGEIESKSIVGVILMTQRTRQYWKESFEATGGGTPPDCSSQDGVTGRGNPGGDCGGCKFSEFDQVSGRQACKENRLIFMVLKDDILPIMISAPPTSLKNVRKYLLGLTSKQRYAHSAYTELTLETDKSKDGISYPKINIRKVGDVENPDITAEYAKMIRPYLEREAVRATADGV